MEKAAVSSSRLPRSLPRESQARLIWLLSGRGTPKSDTKISYPSGGSSTGSIRRWTPQLHSQGHIRVRPNDVLPHGPKDRTRFRETSIETMITSRQPAKYSSDLVPTKPRADILVSGQRVHGRSRNIETRCRVPRGRRSEDASRFGRTTLGTSSPGRSDALGTGTVHDPSACLRFRIRWRRRRTEPARSGTGWSARSEN